jgi:hypothetical protein
MKMTGHKTESVYRRYAIVAEGDLIDAGQKLSTRLLAPADQNTPRPAACVTSRLCV